MLSDLTFKCIKLYACIQYSFILLLKLWWWGWMTRFVVFQRLGFMLVLFSLITFMNGFSCAIYQLLVSSMNLVSSLSITVSFLRLNCKFFFLRFNHIPFFFFNIAIYFRCMEFSSNTCKRHRKSLSSVRHLKHSSSIMV